MSKKDQVLNFEYNNGEQEVFPAHDMVKSWMFKSEEKDEASLAHYMAVIAEKNGMNQNDLASLFPAVLRMLKNNSSWVKNS